MADNIKQIKVEGVSYDLNAKYIQDGSGNPKTWQNIADMINAGVKLVTDNARKEAAGDGATATGSAGAHTHSVTIAAHSHSVTVGAHSHTITPTTNTFTYDLKVPDHSHSYTKPTAHTHSIAQHTHSVTVKGNNN